MGFKTRWDFILDKARKELKKEEEDLLTSWVERIARAHKKFRVDLGPEETQRLAELDWWKHLCKCRCHSLWKLLM
jgi:phage-related minor tail protein